MRIVSELTRGRDLDNTQQCTKKENPSEETLSTRKDKDIYIYIYIYIYINSSKN